jgi:hypothetical protein
VLGDFAAKGLKCACGNSISDEMVDTAVSTSERGRLLIDGSRWFTILLVHNLVQFGVPLAKILVEQLSGGDEMDCIADINAEIALFELKDKEFNLGNAYSFGAKIGIIEPDHPVIITTEHVGGDAREHFAKSWKRGGDPWAGEERSPANAVRYIEGIQNFKTGLMDLINEISMNDAGQEMEEVLPKGSVSPPVVLKWLGDRFLPPEGRGRPRPARK